MNITSQTVSSIITMGMCNEVQWILISHLFYNCSMTKGHCNLTIEDSKLIYMLERRPGRLNFSVSWNER